MIRRTRLGRTAALALALLAGAASAQAQTAKPTIVLVHGAFADSSSWNRVIPRLEAQGYTVVAAANPLRSLAGDAAYVSSVLHGIKGPIVLVGHSYGGEVISNAARDDTDVKALVFVSAVAPEAGESAQTILAKFPGSLLPPTLSPSAALPGGGHDLTVQQDKFRAPFAADLPEAMTRAMAATQRPVTDTALGEASGPPAWKTIPSWFVYGSADQAIPATALDFMAKRADSKHTLVVKGASHVVMLSHPEAVAKVIEEAAASVK